MIELLDKEPVRHTEAEDVRNGTTFIPRFDILESKDEWILYGDLPGVLPEDLEICYENRELTIYGRVAPRHENGRRIYGEYELGHFRRVFTIGEVLDASQIHAEFRNGVVCVHLPKTEAVKLRRVPVQSD